MTDIELDGVTFAQVVDALAIHGTLMEEIVLPAFVLDEPEPFVHA
jgi:hypothetical protein